jgi:hypothetical protein
LDSHFLTWFSQVFVCTEADETTWVLTAEPRIVCDGMFWPQASSEYYYTGSNSTSSSSVVEIGEHTAMVNAAFVFMSLTVVGIPLCLGFILFQRNQTGGYLLQQAQGELHDAMQETGWTPESYQANESIYHVLYGSLISYFRPDYWYWILVLLTRKCLLAAALCVQTGLSAFNLNLAAGVVLGAYVLQIKCKPYEHFDNSKKHWSNRMKSRRSSGFGGGAERRSSSSQDSKNDNSLFEKIAGRMVDPNWLEEMSLLVCLVVILAGSTFTSIKYEESIAAGDASNLHPNFFQMQRTMENFVLIAAPLMVLFLGIGSACELRESSVAASEHSEFSKKLPLISRTLRQLPMEDPPPDSEAYYAIKNPVQGTDREKLEQLKKLRAENVVILQSFFGQIYDDYGLDCVTSAEEVGHGCIFVKSNSKTDASTLAKAHRPTIRAVSPKYGLEHIRDHFRFKCVVNNVIDAFLFLHSLVESDWEVVKFDIAKFVDPKEWG